ncbi:uncharacterized protein LOC122057758 [Macadamia integrifolia]|uniref:uncharacterized protein LOC122057758 n=1 Tax=Macadamia integrifolia TaxID=60698 RepID=UPI001C530452|nr:uncharacterized protein LOC122057758 [Macadamia integrifolia]
MEKSLEKPDHSGILKKQRSLDLQSLYVEKSGGSICKGEAEDRVLKRKKKSPSENEESGLGQGKKKRNRKEVSLSSFEPANKKGKKSLNAIGGSGLNLGSSTLNNPAFKLSRFVLHQKTQGKKKNAHAPGDGNLQNFSGLRVISDSLDDNIPKRPRGLSRRKKFQSNQITEQVGTSSSKVSSAAQIIKLTSDSVTSKIPSEGKEKKVSDDLKENGSSSVKSTRHLRDEDGGSVRHNGGPTLKNVHRNRKKRQESTSKKQNPADEIERLASKSAKNSGELQEDGGSVRHNGDPTLKNINGNRSKRQESTSKKQNPADEIERLASKSAKGYGELQEDGGSVRQNGDPTLKNVHRNRRNRRESTSKKQNPADEIERLVGKSAKNSGELQEEDEENLEQNAARMLSSRFDPSCTGFTGNNKASPTSQSMNGPSLVPLFGQGVDYSAGFESTSADAAGRVLRPRKQHKEKKGLVRKRRHFYEILSGDLDAYWVLNRRIKVFWPLDQSWYFGLVTNYDPEMKLHHVKYDDRDEEWINLHNERFKLLLLPSEVPGKFGPEKSEQGCKKVEDQDEDVNIGDSNFTASYMDSEPIISWLARSTHRVKSSPLGSVKKRKRSYQVEKFVKPVCSDDHPSERCLGVNSARTDALLSKPVLEVRPSQGEVTEKSTMASTSYPNGRKQPFVYFRRRFHKRGQEFGNHSEESSGCKGLAGSVSFLASVVDGAASLEEHDVTLQGSGHKPLTNLDGETLLWSCENSGLFKSSFQLMKLKQGKLKFNFPLHWFVYNDVYNAEFFWLYRALLFLQFGKVVAVWPKVLLEMLFVDNVVGLRFMLFEGCLIQAVAFLCLVLSAFHQPDEHGRLVDLQLPVTSIRFKLSGFRDIGKQFVFVVYNFLEVKNSKWLYLDCKLKKHCSVTKQLPLAECTYDNIKVLESGCDWLVPLVAEEPIMRGGLRRKSRQGIVHMGMSNKSVYIDADGSSSSFNEKHWKLPPFVLSFAAAPSFFLSLHLKLLMDNNVASMSFQNHNSMSLLECPENGGRVMDVDCPVVDSSNHVREDTLENGLGVALRDGASSWLSCAKPKEETDNLSINNGGDWLKSTEKYFDSELNVTGTSVGPQGSRKEIDDIVLPRRQPCQHSVSEQSVGKSWPSVSENYSSPDRSETGDFSCLNGVSVQIPPHSQGDSQSCDVGTPNSQQSTFDVPWNMNDFAIRGPNPTAPRSVWHRNRHSGGCSSFGRSKMWMDEGAYFIHSDFGNGSRKPRTQSNHVSQFGGYDFSSKPRSHLRKARSHKRIRNDDEKMATDCSGGPQRHTDLLSCEANLLITAGDRGWRECGAQLVLEFVDHKDWRLLVKVSGAMKYSFKAHQFLQPGTTNRYTHAMMWKGGKDWTLEFPDRSQWTLFREMHEECYNRNIRAATVKNIPIPGVRFIEESDDHLMQTPFVRSSPKYFRQVENEVEMALNPSCVLYDMDSEDDDWMSRFNASIDIDGNNPLVISEEIFERTMDMFEKVAYSQQRDDITSDEIEELMVGVGPNSVIKAIHEHWLQKRRKNGMPLIRQFQPPLWERYQQLLKEWELAINRGNNFPNGCKEKATVEKPPMFAFCLKPRGLEVLNKGPKHRSHRKCAAASGHSNAFARDQDGVHVFGRKLNGYAFGEERSLVTGHNHESDASTWLQTSTRVLSPRDAVSTGYLSMSSDGAERNQYPKLNRNKLKKIGTFLYPNDIKRGSVPDNQRLTSRRNWACRSNMGLPEWPSQRQYQPEGSHRQRAEQLGCSDLDEFRLRDASGAAQHASNMAKLKREKAQRLLYRADLAIHKAVVALMTAESIKAAESECTEDG